MPIFAQEKDLTNSKNTFLEFKDQQILAYQEHFNKFDIESIINTYDKNYLTEYPRHKLCIYSKFDKIIFNFTKIVKLYNSPNNIKIYTYNSKQSDIELYLRDTKGSLIEINTTLKNAKISNK